VNIALGLCLWLGPALPMSTRHSACLTSHSQWRCTALLYINYTKIIPKGL